MILLKQAICQPDSQSRLAADLLDSWIMSVAIDSAVSVDRLACLEALEQRVLWLAVWMIHHANHLRPKRDGLKVGGHQASSASMVVSEMWSEKVMSDAQSKRKSTNLEDA